MYIKQVTWYIKPPFGDIFTQ